MTRLGTNTLLSLVSFLFALGCASPWAIEPPDEDIPVVDGDGADDFVSHVAGQSTDESMDGGGAAAPEAGRSDSDAGEAERAIGEADIIQIDGDRLYALSRHAGLTIIDIADPTSLSVLGRYRTSATPFEMYLREGVAYVMFNGFYRWVADAETRTSSYQQTARMVALDVRDPAAITTLGEHDVPGEVSDSRMVGDVLYLVTFQNGWCWGCERTANTQIASFDASDPTSFEAIDHLSFEEDERAWGRRSISVTSERMYVAGPNWSDEGGLIQVVDISDPSGSLSLGAEVPVAGRIDNRWQMDEHDGVLRVISQVGGWNSGAPPVVETFTVAGAADVTPLGSLEMVLPRPEDLRSVRFDAERAYAITFERVDPLFTIDLSDPAAPRQMGELEIPGWVYHMEPRGDRVYALGFDDAAEGRGMTVSIFDVSDMTAPTMLDRVVFGGSWSWAVEDQDRIHKAFNLLLDRGLILVPFAGSDSDPETCSWRGQSGIQIIEVAGDDLRLRGVAPQIGTARRSILRGDTLLGVSDHAVQSFDITDRDAPAALDRLEVARNVTSVHVLGEQVLRFGNDWWTDRTVLDLADAELAGDTEGLGELDLGEILANERTCSSSHRWGSAIYVHGDHAYIPRYSQRWDSAGGRSENETQITFWVIDISEPDNPHITGSFDVEAIRNVHDGSTYAYEQYADIVMTDSALLVGRRRGSWRYDPYEGTDPSEVEYSYDVFSLEDPAAPRFTVRFAMPEDVAGGGWGHGYVGCGVDMAWGWWYPSYGSTSAMVSGDVVASNHAEPVDDGTGRVRYYLDRLDVSDPGSPRLLPSVNIPGQLARYDHARRLVVTLEDDLRTFEASGWDQCSYRGVRTRFDSDEGICRVWDRHLNTLAIDGERAVRLSRAALDTEARASQRIAVSEERIFVARMDRLERYGGYDTIHPIGREILAFALASNGQLQRLPTTELEDRHGWYWQSQLAARGTRAFLTESSSLTVIDTTDKATPELTEHEMPGWYCRSLQVDEERAYCALGPYGVLSFDL